MYTAATDLLHVHPNTLHTKATIHQDTTMLATSKNVLFPGHDHHANHLYCWPDTLIITQVPVRVIIKANGHQYAGVVVNTGYLMVSVFFFLHSGHLLHQELIFTEWPRLN